jgi:hypothetical protein
MRKKGKPKRGRAFPGENGSNAAPVVDFCFHSPAQALPAHRLPDATARTISCLVETVRTKHLQAQTTRRNVVLPWALSRRMATDFAYARVANAKECAMKKVLLFISVLMAFPGCAYLRAAPGTVNVVDEKKVQMVEQSARRNRVQVIWLNMPTRQEPAVKGN